MRQNDAKEIARKGVSAGASNDDFSNQNPGGGAI